MSVRRMRASELSQVQALACQLWPDDPLVDLDGQRVFVWERQNGTLGGFASFSIRPFVDGADSAPCPHLEGWFVAADIRRSGVGRALIATVEEWCREHGFRELTSDALLDNEASLRAHAAIGFQQTERIQYFKKPIETAARVESYDGSRSELRPLFEQADDSAAEIDSYIELGEVFVARSGQRVIGHVQLIGGADWEIKSIAVSEDQRGHGIGSTLVHAALDRAFSAGASRVLVATATADIDNLRFYQRLGFRMAHIERDAFNAARGYSGQQVDGIPVRDRVWFSIDISERGASAREPNLRHRVPLPYTGQS